MARKSAASLLNTSRETPAQHESWRYREQFAIQPHPPMNSSAHHHSQPPTISSTAPKFVVSSSGALPGRWRTKRANARLSFATSNRPEQSVFTYGRQCTNPSRPHTLTSRLAPRKSVHSRLHLSFCESRWLSRNL